MPRPKKPKRDAKLGLVIVEQVHPKPPKGARYRIVENMLTSDGVRSRLTNNVSDNLGALLDITGVLE